MYRPVVFVAVGGCGMDKPTVRPRLTWSGSEPAVAHRKLLGQSADYRHLFRRKIVHHILWIEGLSRIGRLVDVVFDKPIHGRNGSRASDIWHPEQLRVDVGPQFARIGVRDAHGALICPRTTPHLNRDPIRVRVCSVPSNPSNVADFGYSFPNMLSNERFSSMSTTIWSIFSRLISSQTGAIRWSFLFWALFVATPQRARITDQPHWSE